MLILGKTIELLNRTFVVSILTDEYGLLVRKTELIHGISVPIDETYVLDIEQASWFHQRYINQIYSFQLN